MNESKDDRLDRRLDAAKNAKASMKAKFRQRPALADPGFAERRAAREAVSAARDLRIAERETKLIAENERIASEREAHARAAATEQAAASERAAVEKAASDAAVEAERKSIRDARYASRKARR